MTKMSLKRKEPLDGNSFTADWANNTRGGAAGDLSLSDASTRPSTVANLDIDLNFYEVTALLNGQTMILEDMLKDRLGINIFTNYEIIGLQMPESVV